MSECLKASEHLKVTLSDISIGIYQEVAEDISYIETELKEYDELFKMFPLEETTARQMLIVLTQLGIKDGDTLLKKLKALEILKKVFNSSSTYKYKLKDSLECGWITQEEYDLLKDVML